MSFSDIPVGYIFFRSSSAIGHDLGSLDVRLLGESPEVGTCPIGLLGSFWSIRSLFSVVEVVTIRLF